MKNIVFEKLQPLANIKRKTKLIPCLKYKRALKFNGLQMIKLERRKEKKKYVLWQSKEKEWKLSTFYKI